MIEGSYLFHRRNPITKEFQIEYHVGLARTDYTNQGTTVQYELDRLEARITALDTALNTRIDNLNTSLSSSINNLSNKFTNHSHDINNLSGILSVSRGGTGVSSITGLIKGNGTGAFTTAIAGVDFSINGLIIQALAPPRDDEKLWICTTNGIAHYWGGSDWVTIKGALSG